MGLDKALVVTCYPEGTQLRRTELESLEALKKMPGFESTVLNTARFGFPGRSLSKGWTLPTKLLRTRFDVVFFHYSFLGQRTWGPLFYGFREHWSVLASLRGTKVAFPQDEAAFAQVLDDWLTDLGVDLVGSVHFEKNKDIMYQKTSASAQFFSVLPGYLRGRRANWEFFRPPADRQWDVVYAAQRLPFWVGGHGQLKARLLDSGGNLSPNLRTSFESSPMKGKDWLEFLANSRTMLGCEGGYSAFDPYGAVRAMAEWYSSQTGELGTFDEFSLTMPPRWDAYQFKTITPRILEAASLGVVQVLVEGDYSGLLTPGEDYVPIRKDLADLADAVALALSPDSAAKLRNATYRNLVESGQYTWEQFQKRCLSFLR